MNRFTSSLAAALTVLSLGVAAPAFAADPAPDGSDQPAAVSVPNSDHAMDEAIAEAQRTLPIFWRVFDGKTRGASNFQVNVGLPAETGGKEFIWLVVISHDANGVTGRVDNPPDHLPGIVYGQTITVKYDVISDWGYEKDGKFWGNFTTREMLKYAPADVVQQMNAVLSPTPLEPGLH